MVVEDARRDPRWAPLASAGYESGPRSCWSVPIVGSSGVLGAISGYADTVGRPQADQLELVSLYASHAAAAIDLERLLAEATRRNRILETLRGVLDTLAGPKPAQGGLAIALLALCRGLGADAIALHNSSGEVQSDFQVSDLGDLAWSAATELQLRSAAHPVLASDGRVDRARPVGDDVLVVPIAVANGRAVVAAWWQDTTRLTNEALDLLDDAARSLRLALGARGAGSGQRRGRVPAPLTAAPARVPDPIEPRAAHAAHGDPGLCLDPAAGRRQLGHLVAAAVPGRHLLGIGSDGPARR